MGSETVTWAFHYYQTGDPSFVSADRSTTIMPLILSGSVSVFMTLLLQLDYGDNPAGAGGERSDPAALHNDHPLD